MNYLESSEELPRDTFAVIDMINTVHILFVVSVSEIIFIHQVDAMITNTDNQSIIMCIIHSCLL